MFLFYQQKLTIVYSKSTSYVGKIYCKAKKGRKNQMVRVIAQYQMYVCNCPNDFIEKELSTCTKYKGLREKFMCMK